MVASGKESEKVVLVHSGGMSGGKAHAAKIFEENFKHVDVGGVDVLCVSAGCITDGVVEILLSLQKEGQVIVLVDDEAPINAYKAGKELRKALTKCSEEMKITVDRLHVLEETTVKENKRPFDKFRAKGYKRR